MKSLSIFALSTASVAFALTSCEPHSFEETKGLHMEHGGHHEEHHAEEGHAKDDHAKEVHLEKGHEKKAPEVKPEAAKEEPRKTGI